jgi:hypothetical protein
MESTIGTPSRLDQPLGLSTIAVQQADQLKLGG